MSLQENNPFNRSRGEPPVEVSYPAEFHFRIIAEAQMAAGSKLREAVAGYRVTAPLTASRQSTAGRYEAFSLSVMIQDRDELNELDAAMKKVPGVRLVL